MAVFTLPQAKEAEGTETDVPAEVKEKLTELTMDLLRPLKVSQLKEVSLSENTEKHTHRHACLCTPIPRIRGDGHSPNTLGSVLRNYFIKMS